MTGPTPALGSQPDHKNGHKRPEPAPVPELAAEFAPPAALSAGPLSAAGDASVPAQASRLAAAPLHTVQRQALAAHIGQRQGNRHLQRVVAFRGNGHAPASPQTVNPPAAPTVEEMQPAALGTNGHGPLAAGAAGETGGAEPGLIGQTPAAAVGPDSAAARAPASHQIQRGFFDALTNPRQAVLGKIAEFARNVPGYHLLALILGRDPITSQPVERNAKNVFRAALSLVPGGSLIFDNLDQSGAIDKAFAWLEGQFAQLGLSWESIKDLFKRAWDALSVTDLLNPFGVWDKLKGIFLPPIERIKNFVVGIGQKVLEFIFEGVLEKLGGGQVLALLKRAGAAFMAIVKDPVGFLGNLMRGVKQGFLNFVANIGAHLKKGLISWLFGELAQTGIQLPQTFDLKGILTLVLQVLGLTWQALRAQAAKVLGEKVVGVIETTFGLFKIIREQGLGGLWEYLKEQIGNLKDMVMGAVKDLVIAQVVQAGVQWLVGMLAGPAGAVVKAIKMIYDVVMWFINNGSRLLGLINAIVDSFGAIASGAIGVAAKFVEDALSRAVPVVIGFLASLLGLGGLGSKIKGLIQKIQAPIQKGIGWVLNKAKTYAAKLFKTVKGALGGNETEADKQKRLDKGVMTGKAAVEKLGGNVLTGALLNPVLGAIRLRYRLGVLEATQQDGYWAVRGELQRKTVKTNKKAGSAGKMDLVTISFAYTKYNKTEFGRQLRMQATAINAMQVDDWLARRNEFLERKDEFGSGRHPESKKEQEKYRAVNRGAWIVSEIARLRKADPNLSMAAARTMAAQNFEDQAALHRIDQVAGGDYSDIAGFGDSAINSSIGSQWSKNSRIGKLDAAVKAVAPADRKQLKMNVKLDLTKE